MTTTGPDAFGAMRNVRIGDAFTVNGRTYTLATYSMSSCDAYFTARVFARNGGTRDVRIRWDANVTIA